MLANEKAVSPLVDFLKSTEVGAREGANKRELEWERRDDLGGGGVANRLTKSVGTRIRRENFPNVV